MANRWSLEKIKNILLDNNSILLSSDEDYYNQINKSVPPMKVKLDVKCFNCKDGVIFKRDIDHIINRKQNMCLRCSKKKLSEKMKKQNIKWWEDEQYRNKMINIAKSKTGEKNHNWNSNLTQEDREIQRNTNENYEFRKNVYERDNYICQCCGYDKGKILVAHHLDSWNVNIENRYNVDNSITLCKKCHKEFHSLYGYGENTKEQFEEFIKEKELNSSNDFILIRNKNNNNNIMGVNWNKNYKNWTSRISYFGKEIFLNTYDNIEDAITIRLLFEKFHLKEASPQKYLFEKYNIDKYSCIGEFLFEKQKVKGISYNKRNKKWIAIGYGRNGEYLGIFETYKEAVIKRLQHEINNIDECKQQKYIIEYFKRMNYLC